MAQVVDAHVAEPRVDDRRVWEALGVDLPRELTGPFLARRVPERTR